MTYTFGINLITFVFLAGAVFVGCYLAKKVN